MKLLGIAEPKVFVCGLPNPELFVLAPNAGGGLVLDVPKPTDGAVEPNTGAAVFVPNEGVVVFPNTGLFSIPKPDWVLKVLF